MDQMDSTTVVYAENIVVVDESGVPRLEQAVSPPKAIQASIQQGGNSSKCTTCVIVAVVAILFIVVSGGAAVAAVRKNRREDAPAPTLAPTVALCPEKRVYITELCNLPDLDDDWFGRDTTMDIKVLLDSEQYWPRDLGADCDGKTYKEACVIPDTYLMNTCFSLKSPGKLSFGTEASPARDLKVTIYDEDIGTDEFLDVLVPVRDWYFPSNCEDNLELEFFVLNKLTSIKMLVDTIEEGEEEICGADLATISVALETTAELLDGMQDTLEKYVQLHDEDRMLRITNQNHRQLLFPALFAGARFLVSGIGSLVGGFARGARSNPLGTTADITTIGSAWFSKNGPAGQLPPDRWEETEEYFQQVLARFDQVDSKLDGIQSQLQKGFQAIELVVSEAFAKQELDDWVNGHLAILDEDYRAYLNPSHTPATRLVYEEIFRDSCRTSHSPFTTFKVLYSHSCSDCQLSSGSSQQFILDTFVDLANKNIDDLTERVLWFRKSFGTVIMGAMAESMYLHSVCLYQPYEVCQNEDPVWVARLEDMATAMEEVAVSLTNAEQRLE